MTPAPVARAVTAVALLAAAACHPRRPPPDLSLDPAELLAAVRTAQQAVTSVQGRARVDLDSADGSGGLDQYLVAERPGRVRVEAVDFFGNVVALLAVADGRLALYDARARTFTRGAATPANLARLTRVPLSPEALATLLCGSAPLLDGSPVAAEPGDGRVLLTVVAGDLEQRLEVGPGAALLASRVRRRDGRGLLPDGVDAEFSGHRPRGGRLLPTEVTARTPGDRVVLSLRWRELEVNQPVDPGVFRLDQPAGARVVDLDQPPP